MIRLPDYKLRALTECSAQHSCSGDLCASMATNLLKERAERKRRKARVAELEAAINWALGCSGEFRGRAEKEGAYWWRRELRERAKLVYVPEAASYARPRRGDK